MDAAKMYGGRRELYRSHHFRALFDPGSAGSRFKNGTLAENRSGSR